MWLIIASSILGFNPPFSKPVLKAAFGTVSPEKDVRKKYTARTNTNNTIRSRAMSELIIGKQITIVIIKIQVSYTGAWERKELSGSVVIMAGRMCPISKFRVCK